MAGLQIRARRAPAAEMGLAQSTAVAFVGATHVRVSTTQLQRQPQARWSPPLNYPFAIPTMEAPRATRRLPTVRNGAARPRRAGSAPGATAAGVNSACHHRLHRHHQYRRRRRRHRHVHTRHHRPHHQAHRLRTSAWIDIDTVPSHLSTFDICAQMERRIRSHAAAAVHYTPLAARGCIGLSAVTVCW